jgi:Tol biopolymer transport system component
VIRRVIWLLLVVAGCRPIPADPPAQRILYLGWDAAGVAQLWLADVAGTEPRQLGNGSADILDYAPDPQGQRVLLARSDGAGGSALWLWPLAEGAAAPNQPLLDCAPAHCTAPGWNRDGTLALFEWRETESSLPRLHWLDPDSGATAPIFTEPDLFGVAARFSADGGVLSYTRLLPDGVDGIYLYNLESADSLLLPTFLGIPLAWHPAERVAIFPDLHYFGERIAVHLLLVDHNTPDGVRNLTEATSIQLMLVEDEGATWHPGGEWIVFTRRPAGIGAGAQLWQMRPDGSEAVALTEDVGINHSRPSFSADGTLLLHQQFALNQPAVRPSIMLLEPETGAMRQVAAEGTRPQWVPIKVTGP